MSLFSNQESVSRRRIIKQHKKNGKVYCPRCLSTSVTIDRPTIGTGVRIIGGILGFSKGPMAPDMGTKLPPMPPNLVQRENLVADKIHARCNDYDKSFWIRPCS